MAVSERIQAIIDQLGGRGIRGALVYCGTKGASYTDRGLCRSEVNADGTISYGVGIALQVNGKRGENWQIVVTLEPNDTYIVRLWRALRGQRAAGRIGEVLTEVEDVYCDNLQETVERVYDDAIKQYCNGFINIG